MSPGVAVPPDQAQIRRTHEDRSLLDSEEGLEVFIGSLDERVRQGKSIAIHCRAGIGRSSMLCACLLVKQGFSVESAFQKIQEARGCVVPDTAEQRTWVESFVSKSKSE